MFLPIWLITKGFTAQPAADELASASLKTSH
jgi:hypothetical protein